MTENFYKWKFVNKDQVIKVLEELKQLYSDPSKWVSYPLAININNQKIDIFNIEAVAWSSLGATTLISNKLFPSVGEYVCCATREFLDDLSNHKLFKQKLSYQEEYDLICSGLEFLIQLK